MRGEMEARINNEAYRRRIHSLVLPLPNHQPTPNMPYYEIEVAARKTICVKADNPEDARHTAIMECTAMEWDEGDADVMDDYGDGTDSKHKEFIERYKLGGQYYETEYNEDVPPIQP